MNNLKRIITESSEKDVELLNSILGLNNKNNNRELILERIYQANYKELEKACKLLSLCNSDFWNELVKKYSFGLWDYTTIDTNPEQLYKEILELPSHMSGILTTIIENNKEFNINELDLYCGYPELIIVIDEYNNDKNNIPTYIPPEIKEKIIVESDYNTIIRLCNSNRDFSYFCEKDNWKRLFSLKYPQLVNVIFRLHIDNLLNYKMLIKQLDNYKLNEINDEKFFTENILLEIASTTGNNKIVEIILETFKPLMSAFNLAVENNNLGVIRQFVENRRFIYNNIPGKTLFLLITKIPDYCFLKKILKNIILDYEDEEKIDYIYESLSESIKEGNVEIAKLLIPFITDPDLKLDYEHIIYEIIDINNEELLYLITKDVDFELDDIIVYTKEKGLDNLTEILEENNIEIDSWD